MRQAIRGERIGALFMGAGLIALCTTVVEPVWAEEAKDGVGTRAVSGVPQQGQMPTFPQKFDVQGPEADTFGFAVTQPGPVVVDVTAQGAPVIVTLQSPGGQPIVQQATGNLRMNYTVTPQDVQRSLFWHVQVRLAQPIPPQLGGRASGIVSVQHPPANQMTVQQTIQAISAKQRTPTQQEQEQGEAQVKAKMDQVFQQRKTQFEQQQQQRRAALHAQIQPQLDQLKGRMGGPVRPRGLDSGEGTTSEPEGSPNGEVGTRALQLERLKILPLAPAPAVITSLSVTQGQPGDPVIINGSGFGNNGGEVHFILGPNNDVVYTGQTWWYDNQILVNVPDVTGLPAYGGQIYIVRNSDKVKSLLAPFRFNPALEIREIRATMDRVLKWPVDQASPADRIKRASANFLAGFKDNDVFFGNTRLKNGWIADEAFVYCEYNTYGMNFCNGGAYVWEIKKGTDWPYLNVRWWLDPAPFANYSHIYYSFAVRIVGPKGMPDGVVVP